VKNIGTHAFSMCLGSFGGSTDREMILVQHIDGHVTIYDYDVISAKFAYFELHRKDYRCFI
jgi:hypothetical protein